jgi:hypothetical protein
MDHIDTQEDDDAQSKAIELARVLDEPHAGWAGTYRCDSRDDSRDLPAQYLGDAKTQSRIALQVRASRTKN